MHRSPLVVALACTAAVLAGCTSSSGAKDTSTPQPTVTGAARSTPGTAEAPAASLASGSAGPAAGPADWPMYHRFLDRDGLSTDMPHAFGAPRLVQTRKLDHAVYASPVAVAGIIVAATEGNTVYAFRRTGQPLWTRHLGSPSPAAERPCGNIDPLGITGTPVVVGGTVYVSPELGAPPRHQLVALDLRTGAVKWRRSIDLPGVETRAMQQRGALTVTAARVWVPFGGLAGDCGGYKGRLIGIRLDGSGTPVEYTVPTAREAGIWAPPGPLVDDTRALYVAVGNGASGSRGQYDYSDSVLKISAGGSLLDSFSPATWRTDNDGDLDLGSQGPAIVGRWIFTAGKSGTAYVLRRDHLGGIGGEVSRAAVCTSFGGTAVQGDVVYVPCTDGVRAVRIDDAGGLHVLWHARATVTGSPVIGGGRLWALDPAAGVLYALDPATGADRGRVAVGTTSRFATPALYGPDVLVPTMAGLSIVRVA